MLEVMEIQNQLRDATKRVIDLEEKLAQVTAERNELQVLIGAQEIDAILEKRQLKLEAVPKLNLTHR